VSTFYIAVNPRTGRWLDLYKSSPVNVGPIKEYQYDYVYSRCYYLDVLLKAVDYGFFKEGCQLLSEHDDEYFDYKGYDEITLKEIQAITDKEIEANKPYILKFSRREEDG